jgi:hypothetical protein
MDEIRTRKALRDHAGLEAEFLQEIAEALGNAGERVERALASVEQSERRIEELRDTLAGVSEAGARGAILGRLRAEIALYNDRRDKAKEHYRWLIIHREAVGFRNHKLVAEQYHIPPPIKNPEGWISEI